MTDTFQDLPRYIRQLPPRVDHILRLAEIIRAVDGSHDKGAAALAEAILSHPGALEVFAQPRPVPVAERLPVASDVHFEFVVSDADYCTQAGGIAPTYAQAVSEGQNYLAQYQQEGLHTLEVRRVEVLPLPSVEVAK